MNVVRWRLKVVDADHVDFAPVDDEIEHEVGVDCICGPRTIEPTEKSPETVWRHHPLRESHGGF